MPKGTLLNGTPLCCLCGAVLSLRKYTTTGMSKVCSSRCAARIWRLEQNPEGHLLVFHSSFGDDANFCH